MGELQEIKAQNDMDPAVWARYEELVSPDCKQPGKQREINSLINSQISRRATGRDGKLQPKTQSVSVIFSRSMVNIDDESLHGLD